MSKNTAIEWCDHTFNPWIGCTVGGWHIPVYPWQSWEDANKYDEEGEG